MCRSISAAPPSALWKVGDEDRRGEREPALLGEGAAECDVLRDPVEQDAEQQRRPNRCRREPVLDGRVHHDVGERTTEERRGHDREARGAVCLGDELEGDRRHHRPARERHHGCEQPASHGPDGREHGARDERDGDDHSDDEGFAHGGTLRLVSARGRGRASPRRGP